MPRHSADPELLPLVDDERAPRTVGYEALLYADDMTSHLATADRFSLEREWDAADGAKKLAKESHEMLKASLGKVRGFLGDLDSESREQLSGYLAGYFKKVNLSETRYVNLTDWLADAETGADDRTLLTFLREHAREVALQNQRPEAKALKRELKADRRRREIEGARQGWISERALETLDEIDDMEVIVGDVFDTALKNRAGYHRPGTNWIVVAQGGRDVASRPAFVRRLRGRVTYHEENHLRFGSKLTLAHFREEAMAEHEAQTFVLEGHGVETMDPGDRAAAGLMKGRYVPGRALVAFELSGGKFTINPRIATLAHTSGAEDSEEFREYDRLLDESWDKPGFREWVDLMVASEEYKIRRANPDASGDDVMGTATNNVRKELQRRSKILHRSDSTTPRATHKRIV